MRLSGDFRLIIGVDTVHAIRYLQHHIIVWQLGESCQYCYRISIIISTTYFVVTVVSGHCNVRHSNHQTDEKKKVNKANIKYDIEHFNQIRNILFKHKGE